MIMVATSHAMYLVEINTGKRIASENVVVLSIENMSTAIDEDEFFCIIQRGEQFILVTFVINNNNIIFNQADEEEY